MRILFTIAHYCKTSDGGKAQDGREHASVGVARQARATALTECLSALHQLYDQTYCTLHHARKVALPSQPRLRHRIDVVICTTRDGHLLTDLPVPAAFFSQHATQSEPIYLGYECHAVLRERLGAYDYYCYLEDDLILHDPWLFIKLAWFTAEGGDSRLLQPNRYEAGPHPLVSKVYIDGDLREPVTAPFQNIHEDPQLNKEVLGTDVVFQRPLNPHAGCFFLNARQMNHWVKQPWFLDRDASFIGPLESAASLGIQRTFKVYKPALENADFLEIQHHGHAYLDMIVGANGPTATQPAATQVP
jgi:hypothetical protein